MPLSTRSLRRVVCPLAGCVMLVSSASAQGVQATAGDSSTAIDAHKPFTKFSNSVHSIRDSLVAVARAQIGTKYVHGGTTPNGFDCSGLVKYVMAALRVELPRTAAQQARVGAEISREDSRLRPGDLLTFGKGKTGVSHIGIYVGQGRYVHASSVAGRVIESDLHRTGSPLIRAWRGVRRVVSGTDSVSTGNGDG